MIAEGRVMVTMGGYRNWGGAASKCDADLNAIKNLLIYFSAYFVCCRLLSFWAAMPVGNYLGAYWPIWYRYLHSTR